MIEIKNKKEFENLWIGEVDASLSNSTQEERIKFVTDIASITLGRLGQNYKEENLNNSQDYVGYISNRRKILYNKLLTEAANKASSPFEFIPVRIPYTSEIFGDMNDVFFLNNIMKYSHIIKSDEYFDLLTNMRTLLNAGIKEKDIPFNTPEELDGFKVIIGKLPKVAYDHLITHRQLSRIAESSRNKRYLDTVEFWKNPKFNNFIQEGLADRDIALLNDLKSSVSDHDLKSEDATKELSCRRLIFSAWAGWEQDKNGWLNLIKQREAKHTQAITAEVVTQIKKLIV